MAAPKLNGNKLDVEELVKSKSKSLKPKKKIKWMYTRNEYLATAKTHTHTQNNSNKIRCCSMFGSISKYSPTHRHTCTLPQSGKVCISLRFFFCSLPSIYAWHNCFVGALNWLKSWTKREKKSTARFHHRMKLYITCIVQIERMQIDGKRAKQIRISQIYGYDKWEMRIKMKTSTKLAKLAIHSIRKHKRENERI